VSDPSDRAVHPTRREVRACDRDRRRGSNGGRTHGATRQRPSRRV